MERDSELQGLREEIARVDCGVLDLLRRRMELATRIGELKAAAGLPVVRPAVELTVLARARQHARQCGVSEEVMEDIFRAMIRASVERQHRVGYELRKRRGGLVLVVGGAGGMGQWTADFLELLGHGVEICDPGAPESQQVRPCHAGLATIADLDRYDALILAVPLRQTPEVLVEVVGRRPRGLVIEFASIKSHLEAALAEADRCGVATACVHPMFGPKKQHYEQLTFVHAVRAADDASSHARLEQLLVHPYAEWIQLPFERHDELMGWLLGLGHLTGMAFATALTRSGLDPALLFACASTTYARQTATSHSVLSEDPRLYLDIQSLNPFRKGVHGALREVLDELGAAVDAEDLTAFEALLAGGRDYVREPSPS